MCLNGSIFDYIWCIVAEFTHTLGLCFYDPSKYDTTTYLKKWDLRNIKSMYVYVFSVQSLPIETLQKLSCKGMSKELFSWKI